MTALHFIFAKSSFHFSNLSKTQMTSVLVSNVVVGENVERTDEDAQKMNDWTARHMLMDNYPKSEKARQKKIQKWKFEHPGNDTINSNSICPGYVVEAIHYDTEQANRAGDRFLLFSRDFDNLFVNMMWMAYCKHLPVTISPHDIWLVILQGFGRHVQANAETLRSKIVSFEGKQKLVVDGTSYIIPGSSNNDWGRVTSDFQEQLSAHLHGGLIETACAGFSNSGPVQNMAFQVALMDAVQSYFDYRVHCMCGIPSVTLEGTLDDWLRLRERAKLLAVYDLEWWTNVLVRVLDYFVLTAEYAQELKDAGRQDSFDIDSAKALEIRAFWNSVCSSSGGSGTKFFSGWINLLYPYTRNGVSRQAKFEVGRDQVEQILTQKVPDNSAIIKMDIGSFPTDVSVAPFTLDILMLGVSIPMQLIAGFFGMAHNPGSQALRLVMGWSCVRIEDK